MSVMPLYLALEVALIAGGCHEILVRCCSGAGRHLEAKKCACGMINSCADPSEACNCNKNDAVWREDSGLLTDKSALPVKEQRIGDTGQYLGVDEKGYHTLGKLRCYGIAHE